MGRYTIGRRRFSWEKKGRQARALTPADPLAGLFVLLPLSYFWMRPIFWFLVAIIGFIGACFLLVWTIQLYERASGRAKR